LYGNFVAASRYYVITNKLIGSFNQPAFAAKPQITTILFVQNAIFAPAAIYIVHVI
jgi:hypothetical protein